MKKSLTRQSNIELLRIIAMLMVITLHVCNAFGSWMVPRITAHPFHWLGIIFTNTACIGCVDIFVLITGWFGTNFKFNGALKLVFQVIFTASCMFLLLWAMGYQLPNNWHYYVQAYWSYWFACSYLVLYLLTPALNAFIQQTDERGLRVFLLTFYAFVVPLSYFFNDIGRGFSAVSFVGLYLLGRYLRLYLSPRLGEKYSKWKLASIWIGISVLICATLWTCTLTSQTATTYLVNILFAYTNPLVIIASSALLLCFARMKFQSYVVNWLALGSFAAYLVHQQLYVRPHFFHWFTDLDARFGTLAYMALALLSILAVYLFSCLLDTLRRTVWKGLVCLFHRKSARSAS